MSDEVKTTEAVADVVKEDVGDTAEGQQPELTDSQKQYLDSMLNQTTENTKKEMQSEIDRRVSKFMKENESLKTQLESERKKTMSAKELEEMNKIEAENKLKQLQRDLEVKTLAFEKTKMINEKKWDEDFLTIVSGENVEEFKLNVEKLSEKLKVYIEEAVNMRLSKGNPEPNKGSKNNESYYTIDEIKKMSRDEITANYDKVQASYINSKAS